MTLLNDDNLQESEIVANCRMNRERNLLGSNGYDRELGFNPVQFLRERIGEQPETNWLDLCCGTGKALVEAAGIVQNENLPLQIIGVDLVSMFHPAASSCSGLLLLEASLSDWTPDTKFDLITCVHGLHYIGDKLGLISRIKSWLKPDGRFLANLDLNNLKIEGSGSNNRILLKELDRAGFEYNPRKKLLQCQYAGEITFPFRYLGADDQAGPNYTGQPAVNSHYSVQPN